MGFFRKKEKTARSVNPKVALIFFGILVLSFFVLQVRKAMDTYANVWIGDVYVRAEVADSWEKKLQGLAGRSTIKNGEGMLFPYAQRESQGIWMKGMKIPIDIVWIDGDRIVDIAPEVPAPPYPDTPVDQLKTYYPRVPATAVLEVPAGFALANGWKIGDRVVAQFDK